MKLLDLFAGIGMWSLGGHWAGIETAAFVEWDKDCQKVLKLRFPNTPIHGDINGFDGKQYRGVADIVCGGFPCQPYSNAGERLGAEDDRDEWGNLCRVCDEVRPRWFVGENVAGILTMEPERFLSDLAGIGYEGTILDFSAASLGLQTLERHIWFVATPYEVGLQRQSKGALQSFWNSQREFQGSDTRIPRGRDISTTRFCRVGKRNTHRLDKSGRTRLQQIGNSMPPQAAYMILNAIKQISSSI